MRKKRKQLNAQTSYARTLGYFLVNRIVEKENLQKHIMPLIGRVQIRSSDTAIRNIITELFKTYQQSGGRLSHSQETVTNKHIMFDCLVSYFRLQLSERLKYCSWKTLYVDEAMRGF